MNVLIYVTAYSPENGGQWSAWSEEWFEIVPYQPLLNRTTGSGKTVYGGDDDIGEIEVIGELVAGQTVTLRWHGTLDAKYRVVAAGANTTFRVKPKVGRPVGTHNYTFTVSASSGTTLVNRQFTLNFMVTPTTVNTPNGHTAKKSSNKAIYQKQQCRKPCTAVFFVSIFNQGLFFTPPSTVPPSYPVSTTHSKQSAQPHRLQQAAQGKSQTEST